MDARRTIWVAVIFATNACTMPVAPAVPYNEGSIGKVNGGFLLGGQELQAKKHVHWYKSNDRHWGISRFVQALDRAAVAVNTRYAGPPLLIGDLSARYGGRIGGHASHRSGRDIDILYFVTSPSGAPVESPGFFRFERDGLATTPRGFVRFDVERNWSFVRVMLLDPDARVQWIFMSNVLRMHLLLYAFAKGEPTDLLVRAATVLHEPRPPALPHDDHMHVRTECNYEEISSGCQPTGPWREWFGDPPSPPSSERADWEIE